VSKSDHAITPHQRNVKRTRRWINVSKHGISIGT